ncbi:MAG: hypothetical protein JNK79_09600 [Chitinophagaceae bacterium]|nr:hypothetical protein [Chitinophagaceae bacterium]
MKILLLSGVSLLFACNISAQDCNGYYFLQNNKTIEMAILNKKGEQNAKQVYTVSNVSNSGSSTTADLESEMFDKKGKSIVKSKAQIKCDGGVMMLDMKMSMPQQPGMSAETDVQGENIYIEYPNNMNVGDNLKNATMHLEWDNKGMKQSMDMEVFDRKVEAKENVTTPAGSWDCYKISYKSKTRIKTMGIGVPMNIEGTEYYAPGFGIVKTESKHGGTQIVAIK